MKKFVLFVIWQFVATASYCQHITHTREEYFIKSHNQSTTGVTLLIVGGVMVTGGAVLAVSQINSFGDEYSDDNSPGILVLGGFVSMLSSIPILLASHRNAKKAMNATAYFKMEKAPSIRGAAVALHPIPGIAVKISL